MSRSSVLNCATRNLGEHDRHGSDLPEARLKTMTMSGNPSSLALGWRIDDDGHPTYWMEPDARVGDHSSNDLVSLQAKQVARHLGIIAQSGSGKSFLLGRLVEELLLNTRCRVAILDPNAEFRNSDSIQKSMWEGTGYDSRTCLGKMPTEADVERICASWQSIPRKIFGADVGKTTGSYEPMRVWWPFLATDLLAEDLAPVSPENLVWSRRGVKLRPCY